MWSRGGGCPTGFIGGGRIARNVKGSDLIAVSRAISQVGIHMAVENDSCEILADSRKGLISWELLCRVDTVLLSDFARLCVFFKSRVVHDA